MHRPMNIESSSFIPSQTNVAEKNASREIAAAKFRAKPEENEAAEQAPAADEASENASKVGVFLNAKA